MTATPDIRPLDPNRGCGFWSYEPQPKLGKGYRYEQVGRYHNYHATASAWKWPILYNTPYRLVIDAFSPNLNKTLHVGHLRNLAIAKSLWEILKVPCPDMNRFAAMYGASLGVKKAATIGLKKWLEFVGYHPETYYDVLLPEDVIEVRNSTIMDFDYHDPDVKVWDGPKGPVLVTRNDGRKLYAYHDLVFAKEVGPTHYVTGHEQREHFNSLGLGDKHLPMGLVLGADGKKMKSRDGTALSATDAMDMVKANLTETKYPDKVAWNVLSWNFLHISRSEDVKFEAEKWTKAESPGMHITYTFARVVKALSDCLEWDDPPVEPVEIELRALADQHRYWLNQAVVKFDPASLANFTHELSRKLSSVYQSHRIVGGSVALIGAIYYAADVLEKCMRFLGMFPVTEV